MTKLTNFAATNEAYVTEAAFRAAWADVALQAFPGALYLGEADGAHNFAAALFTGDETPADVCEVTFAETDGAALEDLARLAVGVVAHQLHGMTSGDWSEEFRAEVLAAMGHDEDETNEDDEEEGEALSLPEGYAFEVERGHFTGAAVGVLSYNGRTVTRLSYWDEGDVEAAAENHAKLTGMSEGPADCIAVLYADNGTLAHIARGTTDAGEACALFGERIGAEIDPEDMDCRTVTAAQADALEAWASDGCPADADPLDI